MEKDTAKVVMLADRDDKGKTRTLRKGQEYSLPLDSASHHVKHGFAYYADGNAPQAAKSNEQVPDAPPKLADDMTVAELTDALTAADIKIPSGSVKADLVALFKKIPKK